MKRQLNLSIRSLFTRKACPVPTERSERRKLAWKHVAPLLGFVVPTVVIGYGFVIPRSCIAGVNELTIGFATTIVGACFTYVLGVRAALAQGAG
jgi:ABC-type Fe3+ transport system permease subunit